MKVGKHGPAFVYNLMWAIVAGLMMGPFMVPWFIGGRSLAELSMIGKGAYHNVKTRSNLLDYLHSRKSSHGMMKYGSSRTRSWLQV